MCTIYDNRFGNSAVHRMSSMVEEKQRVLKGEVETMSLNETVCRRICCWNLIIQQFHLNEKNWLMRH